MTATNKTTAIAVAFSLTLAPFAADALTTKQTRKIVRQEIQRVITIPGPGGVILQGPQGPQGSPGPQGSAGPQGPAGPTVSVGTPLRWAYIAGTGQLISGQGIVQDDLHFQHFEGDPITGRPPSFGYCVDMDPLANGAQVTSDVYKDDTSFGAVSTVAVKPKESNDSACQIYVEIQGSSTAEIVGKISRFYLLVY